jgi:hypothetical protein
MQTPGVPQIWGPTMWQRMYDQSLLKPRTGNDIMRGRQLYSNGDDEAVKNRVAPLSFNSQWHESTVQQKLHKGIRLTNLPVTRKIKPTDLGPKKSQKADWRNHYNERQRK